MSQRSESDHKLLSSVQKDTVRRVMSDGQSGDWEETVHALAALVKTGEITPREVMLVSCMLPDVPQEARNACIWILARPRWHERRLRMHNVVGSARHWGLTRRR